MNKISVIGLDLAKNVFQIHGIDPDGEVVVRKQLKRSQMSSYFAKLQPCLVGMEACGGAHLCFPKTHITHYHATNRS